MHFCRLVLLALVASFACIPLADAGDSKRALPAIVVPALAGKVDLYQGNSDRYMWQSFISIVAPTGASNIAEFQTWATDEDIYTTTPVPWGTATDRPIKASRRQMKFPPHGTSLPPCAKPENPWVANFPLSGCLSEVVYRNKAQYDYIVGEGLNTQQGIADFFAEGKPVAMPPDSLAIKTDWIPINDILDWVPELGTLENVRRSYYTVESDRVEYGLVAMHVSSAQNPQWVWGTFEHKNNPGRCDVIGCFDSFGARKKVVRPNDTRANTQYGPCTKTTAVTAMMRAAGLSAVWDNYCLKSTQVSYTNAKGKPSVLTNTVTERLSVNGELIGSCISCHAYAAFDDTGAPSSASLTMLAYNPIGRPVESVFDEARLYDFMWGLLNAPPPPPP